VAHSVQVFGTDVKDRLLFVADIAGTLVFAVEGCHWNLPRAAGQ